MMNKNTNDKKTNYGALKFCGKILSVPGMENPSSKSEGSKAELNIRDKDPCDPGPGFPLIY